MKLTMGRSFGGALALAAASVLVVSSFVLGGCAKTEEKGPMEKAGAAADRAVEKVKDASAEAAKSMSVAADKAKDAAATAAAAIDKAADKAVAAANKAADKTKEAAAGAAKAASTAVAPKK